MIQYVVRASSPGSTSFANCSRSMLSRQCFTCRSQILRSAFPPRSNVPRHHVARRLQSSLTPARRRLSPTRNVTILIFLGALPITYLTSQWLNDEGPVFSPTDFTAFTLEVRTPVSDTSSIFTLLPTSSGSNKRRQISWPAEGEIWSVQIRQPELNIARSYTPLPPVIPAAGDGEDPLRLLVRHYVGGELSTYLSRVPLGGTIALRGPHPEIIFPEDDEVDEVLFLAGGTGIAPALQLAHALLRRSEETGIEETAEKREGSRAAEPMPLPEVGTAETAVAETAGVGKALPKIHILWAVRSSQECLGAEALALPSTTSIVPDAAKRWLGLSENEPIPGPGVDEATPNPIVEQLNALQRAYPDSLRVEYFPDDRKRFITTPVLRAALSTPSPPPRPPVQAQRSPETQETQPGRKMLLISGPDGFVDHLAGPLTGRDVLRRGPTQKRQMNVGGVLCGVLPPLKGREGSRADGQSAKVKGWEVYRL